MSYLTIFIQVSAITWNWSKLVHHTNMESLSFLIPQVEYWNYY
jgi:hypothetical protein